MLRQKHLQQALTSLLAHLPALLLALLLLLLLPLFLLWLLPSLLLLPLLLFLLLLLPVPVPLLQAWHPLQPSWSLESTQQARWMQARLMGEKSEENQGALASKSQA